MFGDRVYLYGSHDKFNGRFFCMNDYVCYSAPWPINFTVPMYVNDCCIADAARNRSTYRVNLKFVRLYRCQIFADRSF